MTLNCNPLSMQCKYWQSTAADNDDVVVVVVNADIHCVFSSTSFITNDNVLTNEQKKKRLPAHLPFSNGEQFSIECMHNKKTHKKKSLKVNSSFAKSVSQTKAFGRQNKIYIRVFLVEKSIHFHFFFLFQLVFEMKRDREKKREKRNGTISK